MKLTPKELRYAARGLAGEARAHREMAIREPLRSEDPNTPRDAMLDEALVMLQRADAIECEADKLELRQARDEALHEAVNRTNRGSR